MSKTQLLRRLRKAAQRSLWVFTGCVEAISAQAARAPVITKRSSELPVFSQLQLFFFLRADDCNPLILAGFEGIGMAQLAASSLVDPLQRMPLVRSQLLCPAWKAPQQSVPEEASGCVRCTCRLLTFTVISAAGRSTKAERAALRFYSLSLLLPNL